MGYKLSICIPTYNRELELESLLESIALANDNHQVEIVISDNASTDNTSAIVHKYSSKLNLKYTLHNSNVGPDKNFMHCVDVADGEYCWMFGSDDLMPIDGIELVLKLLSDDFDSDVVLLDRTVLKSGMQYKQNWLKYTQSKAFNLINSGALTEYFNSCNSFGGVFSYLSSNIVRKSAWDEVTLTDDFMTSCYSHVYRIFKILKSSGSLYYFSEVTPICRMRVSAFDLFGPKHRMLIDLIGFRKLGVVLFDIQEEMAFKKIFFREHSVGTIIGFLNLCNFKEKIMYSRILIEYGCPLNKIICFNLVTMSGTYKVLKYLKSYFSPKVSPEFR